MNRIFATLLLALTLAALNGCSRPQPEMEDAGLVAPAPAEPVLENRKSDCIKPGSDDGIGGTGCKVDTVD